MKARNYNVMKFGGSCLVGSEDMANAASIISGYRNCVAVVSAISGVTQKLIELYETKDAGSRDAILNSLNDIHLKALSAIRDRQTYEFALEEVRDSLNSVARIASRFHGTDSEEGRALLLSHGERISAIILKWYAADRGVKASSIYADEILHSKDDDLLNSVVDEEYSQLEIMKRIQYHSDQKEVPIITGFFCRSKSGKTALLGRNSSDYTAAIVAYSIPTFELTFWKDVPGLMTGDPKLVKESRVLRILTYDEAEGYIANGARILHPKVIELAKRKDTAIRIKYFREPSSEGTLITNAVPSVELL